MNEQLASCPTCHQPTISTYYFCPNCGTKLKTAPLSTSFSKQLTAYLVSIFAPPFGLWYVYKYARSEGKNAKIVSLICLVLTIISLGVTTWLMIGFMNTVNEQMTKQLQVLQGF